MTRAKTRFVVIRRLNYRRQFHRSTRRQHLAANHAGRCPPASAARAQVVIIRSYRKRERAHAARVLLQPEAGADEPRRASSVSPLSRGWLDIHGAQTTALYRCCPLVVAG